MPGNKILIVDDDVDFAQGIRAVLEANHYAVFHAASKREGLEMIDQISPDLLILDVIMEKLSDGFDMARELKHNDKFKKIKIFMLTAIVDKTGFKYSDSAGDGDWLPVDDYAEKPINPDELISRIRKLLA